MAPRSQPHRIEWPLNAQGVESIDEMFQILFDDVRNGSLFPFTTRGDTLYFDGEENERLGIGAANTVLRTDGDIPEWGKVDLTADVDDVLPIANGGTNSTATPTDGGIAYGDGTSYQFTAQGNFGEALVSLAAAAPIWSPSLFAPNLLINGGFRFAQRTGNSAVLTTFSDTASRTYVFDRWAITNENASLQVAQAQTHTTPETGLTARHYGRFKKITNAGKAVVSQTVLSHHMLHTRGDSVRVQVKLKASTAMTVRIALLQLTSSGTADSIPGYSGGAPSGTFISAFGADGTDPTFGTNLSKITPTVTDNATIASDGLSCSVTTSWQRFGGIFTVPSDCLNLVLVIFSDSDMAVNDELDISEADLHYGGLIKRWHEHMAYSEELMQCQHFYAKSFGLVVAPAQSAGLNSALRGHVSVAGAVANQPIPLRYPVQMRAAGTHTFYNPSAGNAFARNTSVGADATATAIANNNAVGGDIMFTGVAGWLAGAAMAVHYTHDAEF